MRKIPKKVMTILKVVVLLVFIFLAIWYFPDFSNITPKYGATFSARYANDLGLDSVNVYEELIDDMGIKRMRLVAYWDEIEKEKDIYDFSSLDWQIQMSEEKGVDVILSVGRRVPRWPECHIPDWAGDLPEEEMGNELKEYVQKVVERYRGYESVKIWQVENEAFFNVYATETCGIDINEELIDEEIALVRKLDPTRQILMTDSGNLGIWSRAYKRGDIFGSTFYVYLMFDGNFASPLSHNVYKWKRLFNSLLFGKKDTYLIEISIEPWLNDPIAEVPTQELVERLGLDREREILRRARNTGFEYQYLWGVEWIYYMREHGHPEYWDFFKGVFSGNK